MGRSLDARSIRSTAQRWGTCLAWVLAAWLVLLSTATAQSTGGSAGGSSWGSSSSGGSSGSSSGGWSSSSGGSGDDTPSANSYEPPMWAQCIIAPAFLLLLFFLFRGLARLAEPPKIGVSLVRVALDARARRFVQQELAKLAAKGDTSTRSGLADLLASASRALLASKLAWIYCGVEQFAPTLVAEARSRHNLLTADARSRFQHELVRAADGTKRHADAPALTAREHEGEGVVVVTLIVATHAKLRAASPARIDEVEQLLTQLSGLSASEVVALEVVWSPAAEEDRMSTDELEARYGELTRVTAIGGRVFCAHCSGPHTAELAKCPHCGAPTVSGSARGAS